MKFEIKHRYNGEILFSIETDSWRLAVEAAIKSKADLRYADLRYANLRYANLRYANLSSANLSSANLRYADLRYANLSSANLSYAALSYADLRYADLSYADLSSADLRYADLMVFQCKRNMAYYTFDGALRIGCILMPVNEWADAYKEIGKSNNYTEDEIIMYGQFINMCLEHFRRNNP